MIIGSLDKPGQITYPGAGKGHDFGVMTELWDGRINARLGRYLGQSTGYADAMLRYNTKLKLGSRNVRTSFQINGKRPAGCLGVRT